MLKQVARTLQDRLNRAMEFVARHGGEEFCIVLTENSPELAVRVAGAALYYAKGTGGKRVGEGGGHGMVVPDPGHAAER